MPKCMIGAGQVCLLDGGLSDAQPSSFQVTIKVATTPCSRSMSALRISTPFSQLSPVVAYIRSRSIASIACSISPSTCRGWLRGHPAHSHNGGKFSRLLNNTRYLWTTLRFAARKVTRSIGNFTAQHYKKARARLSATYSVDLCSHVSCMQLIRSSISTASLSPGLMPGQLRYAGTLKYQDLFYQRCGTGCLAGGEVWPSYATSAPVAPAESPVFDASRRMPLFQVIKASWKQTQ
jgi:hypothetical protein